MYLCSISSGSVTVPWSPASRSNLFKAFTWLGVSVGSCFISMNLWVVIALTSEANVEQILFYPNVCMALPNLVSANMRRLYFVYLTNFILSFPFPA